MEVDIMNQYVTGTIIKELRERNKMTQLQLADKLGVTDKTISKWETGVSPTILYFLTCISILICMFLISKENLK